MIRKQLFFLLALALAVALALSTALYQRHGPFMGVFGNMCGPAEGGQLCIAPVLQGGWPLPYLFDNPGVSVRDTLSLEDKLDFGFFLLDVWFFAGTILTLRQWLFKETERPGSH